MYLFKIYVDYNKPVCDEKLKEVVKYIYQFANVLNSMSPNRNKYFGDKKGNTRHKIGLYKDGPHGLVSGIICDGFTECDIATLGFYDDAYIGGLVEFLEYDMEKLDKKRCSTYRVTKCEDDPDITFRYVIKKIGNNRGYCKTREAFSKFTHRANEFIVRMKSENVVYLPEISFI